MFWNGAAAGPVGQAAAAGNGAALAVGIQRNALGAGLDVCLVGLACAPQRLFGQAAYPFHDAVHHIVCGLVGLSRRLGDEPYRGAI